MDLSAPARTPASDRYDYAGRKQYRYHEAWREHRDREKFDQALVFGQALPEIRRTVEADLGRRGLVRDRVLGCAIRMLDLVSFGSGVSATKPERNTVWRLSASDT